MLMGSSVIGQWSYGGFHEYYITGGGNFNAIGCVKSGIYDTIWCVGDQGLVFKFHYDFGPEESGEYVILNAPIDQYEWNFKDICFPEIYGDTIFIVGEHVTGGKGIILRSVDGGATWTATFPEVDGYKLACYSIDYANSEILYVGCSRGYILKTIDGGETWNPTLSKPVCEEYDKHANCFVDIWVDKTDPYGNRVWAITDNSDLVVKTTDGGQTWYYRCRLFPANWQIDAGSGVEPTYEGRFHVRALNMDTVYVTLSSGKYGYTEDGGLTWDTVRVFPTASQWLYDIVDPEVWSWYGYWYWKRPFFGSDGVIFDVLENDIRYNPVYDLYHNVSMDLPCIRAGTSPGAVKL